MSRPELASISPNLLRQIDLGWFNDLAARLRNDLYDVGEVSQVVTSLAENLRLLDEANGLGHVDTLLDLAYATLAAALFVPGIPKGEEGIPSAPSLFFSADYSQGGYKGHKWLRSDLGIDTDGNEGHLYPGFWPAYLVFYETSPQVGERNMALFTERADEWYRIDNKEQYFGWLYDLLRERGLTALVMATQKLQWEWRQRGLDGYCPSNEALITLRTDSLGKADFVRQLLSYYPTIKAKTNRE